MKGMFQEEKDQKLHLDVLHSIVIDRLKSDLNIKDMNISVSGAYPAVGFVHIFFSKKRNRIEFNSTGGLITDALSQDSISIPISEYMTYLRDKKLNILKID